MARRILDRAPGRRAAATVSRDRFPPLAAATAADDTRGRGAPPVLRALLGPTNTGKTHAAIERMLEHESGMIGLPLRLLAREVYDRVSARVGQAAVALVTGEEKRLPPHPRYWVSTVEAISLDVAVGFPAPPKIQ